MRKRLRVTSKVLRFSPDPSVPFRWELEIQNDSPVEALGRLPFWIEFNPAKTRVDLPAATRSTSPEETDGGFDGAFGPEAIVRPGRILVTAGPLCRGDVARIQFSCDGAPPTVRFRGDGVFLTNHFIVPPLTGFQFFVAVGGAGILECGYQMLVGEPEKIFALVIVVLLVGGAGAAWFWWRWRQLQRNLTEATNRELPPAPTAATPGTAGPP